MKEIIIEITGSQLNMKDQGELVEKLAQQNALPLTGDRLALKLKDYAANDRVIPIPSPTHLMVHVVYNDPQLEFIYYYRLVPRGEDVDQF
ncbi:hypothetical protein LCGC14_0857290 [marine sediment metagenome]|uniref:Uncharacterized protein n=1 Tax=marine sediment metagenome TaxID=412755 RepID=A0A0F9SFI9_9ZZZZ